MKDCTVFILIYRIITIMILLIQMVSVIIMIIIVCPLHSPVFADRVLEERGELQVSAGQEEEGGQVSW